MFVRYKAQTLPDVYKITKLFFDINFNAQLKFWTDNKMETWFWILGWILSILTVAGNGFTVLLVGGQRRLRTKPPHSSLSVADFCVVAFVVPLLFFCDIRGGCNWPRPYGTWVDFIRWLFAYASIMNLCSLVLDRYMAVVRPLKYVNFMTTRRITKLIFFSWVIPFCLAIFSVFMSLYSTFSLWRIVLSVCSWDFLQLQVNFLFYFHGNSCVQANAIISHLGKTVTFQPPRFDFQHSWQISSCNVGSCGGLRPGLFRNLLAL